MQGPAPERSARADLTEVEIAIDVRCPSCCMTARSTDLRHLRPVPTERSDDLRECRNCGEVFAVGRRPADVATAGIRPLPEESDPTPSPRIP